MPRDESPDHEPPSKSARKRAATALQELGVELAELPDSELEGLDLPDTLLQAIVTLRQLKSHGAQVRQRQYIGKLMRHIDAQAVQDKLAERKRRHDSEVRQFHRIEQWRDRLLAMPEEGVAALLREYPQADGAALKQLLERAGRDQPGLDRPGRDRLSRTRPAHEQGGQRPPAAARELFAWLRELMTPAS